MLGEAVELRTGHLSHSDSEYVLAYQESYLDRRNERCFV
jgi:hypothetical protein